MELVDNNPKTRVGALKAPVHLVPFLAILELASAFADGAKKYAPFNWREEKISVSVYQGAIMRHLAAYIDGEDIAPDSGVHHLSHIMACCAMMRDAESVGMLIDDRPTKGASAAWLSNYYESAQASVESIDDMTLTSTFAPIEEYQAPNVQNLHSDGPKAPELYTWDEYLNGDLRSEDIIAFELTGFKDDWGNWEWRNPQGEIVSVYTLNGLIVGGAP